MSQRLIALLTLVGFTACSAFTGSDDDGNVRVVLSASDQASLAPSLSTDGDDDDDDDGEGSSSGRRFLDRLETAEVTFASLLARNLDGELIGIDMDLPQTVDLKALLAGEEMTLPAGSLPAGEYDQLVVVLTKVDLTWQDGGALSLTPPGGGWTSIVRVAPFTIVDGQAATIELEFRLGGAFREFNGTVRFFPDFNGKQR